MAMKKPPEPAKQKLVSVYSAENEMEARMIQEVLHNAGIESTINAEFAPGIYPASTGDVARQEILVIESLVPQAEQVLSELPNSGAPESESA